MDEFKDCEDVQQGSKYKHQRTIIHIDLDCFYAQVEMLKNPELSSRPVGIKQQHYLITSNYVAREFGVKKCMLISEALALCPKLVIINGEDLHDYRVMSSNVTEVIKQFSIKVEKLGLDENFVDVSDLVSSKLQSKNNEKNTVVGHIYRNEIEYKCTCGCKERLIAGSHIASEIRENIRQQLKMTCCAGIGHNKLLSKLVCSNHKPNQQTTVFPCSATSLVSNLSCVRAIPGIGRKTSDILNALGINSISDSQNCSIELLEKYLGKAQASWLKGACYGVDDTDVKESGKQQVIGLEEASKKISAMEDVCKRLNSLIDRGMVLLQEDGRFPTTIRVSVRKYSHNEEYTRQRETKQSAINPSLFRTSTAKKQIFEIALDAFKKLVDYTKPFHLTLIGLAFTKFQEELPAKSSLLQFFKKKPEESCSEILSEIDDNYKDGSDEKWLSLFPPNMKQESNNKNNNAEQAIFEIIDESVLNELPEEIKAEVLQSYSQKLNQPGPSSSQIKQNVVQCPLGLDQTVFRELPPEIQMELTRDQNQTTFFATSKVPNTSTTKRQNSILKYLKKK